MDRYLPDDPLAFLQGSVRGGRFYWPYHVNMRLQGRYISRQAIIDAVDTYQLVEAYPTDKYLPSYLILARSGHDAFHLLFAIDFEGDNVRVITAYRPSLDEWEADLTTPRTPR
ncbi:MAG TPA: DUF4258 domain-containing protein [Alphaproteobacteria bacterium]|nr:DUF4258 domain-containing protein [Alphaproteobacteria bacterium]